MESNNNVKMISDWYNVTLPAMSDVYTNQLNQSTLYSDLFFENIHIEKGNNSFAKDENNSTYLLTQAWWND